jgi:succinate dehydrogenase / fumarate reductase cytochrome b subunit
MNASQLTIKKAIWSTIGKKVITGVTGLALVLFITGHLAGNLLLLLPESTPFNLYAYKLASLGPLLYLIEAGLAFFFLSHAWTGIAIARGRKQARPVDYAVYKSQGGKSKQTFASRTMIFSGVVLLAFLIKHLIDLKFGTVYYTELAGIGQVRDLHKTTVEFFQSEINVLLYTAVMVLLGLHIRHGFWSAFQSLAALKPRMVPAFFSFGLVLGIAYAAGFILIPVWIYIVH